MSEERQLNIADGLRRITAIEKKTLPQVAEQIRLYSSKKTGENDVIDDQSKHVDSLKQKYNDLLTERTKIKMAIMKANLRTSIVTKTGRKMSLAEAIDWKGVRGTLIGGKKELERMYWNSFSTRTAETSIGRVRAILANQPDMTEEKLDGFQLTVERIGWDAVEVQNEKEVISELEEEIDALINRANIETILKL